ncbi:AAA family ATPase [Mobilicoccus massiliensis]|uniref:AAA family ATPase n=1 Tax=Mobilicoccus massiliensis TaxID=1522310 RepID=UPI0006935AC4|nr:AAA family ATPase [Mobilicoccus massiliensis]
MRELPLIVLVNGLPGSGKTTVAAGLAARLSRAAVVEGDHLQHGMTVSGCVGPGEEPADESWTQLDLRWRNIAALATNFYDAGFSVVVDSLVIPSLLHDLRSALGTRPLAYVHLDPARSVGLARDAARGTKRIGDRFDWVAAEFEPLRELGVWIDSTEQSPRQTVDAAYDALTTGAARLELDLGRPVPEPAKP